MLLAIDVGNTNTVFALHDGRDWVHSWRSATDSTKTADDHASWLWRLADMSGVDLTRTEGCVISTVVPQAQFNFRTLSRRYLNVEPMFIGVALLVPALIAGTNVYRGLTMPRTAPDAWLSAATLVGSALVLALLAPLAQGRQALPGGMGGACWLLIQTLVLVAGYLCYFALQRRAEPVAFSLIGYVMMLVSVGIGMVVFGESVAWTLWPATALIGAALWLIHRFPARNAA